MRRNTLSLVLVVLVVGSLGCYDNQPPPQVNTTTFSSDVAAPNNAVPDGGAVVLGGKGIRLRIFSSGKFEYKDQEAEVLPAFQHFINHSQHEVVAVRTVYSRFGDLLKAEVYYKVTTPADSTS